MTVLGAASAIRTRATARRCAYPALPAFCLAVLVSAFVAVAVPALATSLQQHTRVAAIQRIELKDPGPNRNVTITARRGDRYVIRFDPTIVQVTVEGRNFILTFPNGARIVIANLGGVLTGPNAPVFEFGEREFASATLFGGARAAPTFDTYSQEAAPGAAAEAPLAGGGGYALPPPPPAVVISPRKAPTLEREQAAEAPAAAPKVRGLTPGPSAAPRAARTERPALRLEAPVQQQQSQPQQRRLREELEEVEDDSDVEDATSVRVGQVPRDPNEPVYNVQVDDRLSVAPLVLAHGRPTKVRFGIGPRVSDSVVPAIPSGPQLEELAAGQPLTLNVTLDCLVCRKGTYLRTEITYDPNRRRSNEAVFEIRPSRGAVGQTGGYGLLVFTVDVRGLDLIVIKIPTFVDTVPEALSAVAAEVPRVSFARPDMKGAITPDLVVDIGSGAGKLPIGLNPVNPELRAHMASALRGRPWPGSFESGASVADLSDIVAKTYLALRGVVEQNEAAVQTVYESQGAATALSPAAARLRFDERDKQVALEQLKRHGAYLYKRLFLEGERDLRRTMAALNKFSRAAGRPLRIRIRATDVYAPWQMLYSAPRGAPAVANGFWGFRYEMGTLQKVNASQAPTRTFLPRLRSDDVLLGAWPGADEVGQRGRFLHRHLERRMGGAVLAAHNRADFLAAIRRNSETVKLIVFYGHASSGTVVRPPGALIASALSLPPTLASDWTGERLMFAVDDHLVPLQIDEMIPDDVFDDERNPVFLKQHPIVLLNACETGTGGVEPMNNNGFIARLTIAGAGAVFVTEAPVWRSFAYQFGIDLLDGIAGGRTMQAALHTARIKHLRMQNNPLGLLYSLYGNPVLRAAR